MYFFLEDKQPTKEEPPMRFDLFYYFFYFIVDVNGILISDQFDTYSNSSNVVGDDLARPIPVSKEKYNFKSVDLEMEEITVCNMYI
jgi:hypothetical protein